MYKEVCDAVTRRLDELFPECAIYTDSVEQGLKEPCFFVQFLEVLEEPVIGRRYFRKIPLCIQYFPEEPQPSQETERVLGGLVAGMEYITLKDGDRLRGTGIRGQTEGGVLYFFINYNHFIYKQKETEEAMETIELQKGLVK